MTDTSFVIVGGGLAGAKAAEALREQGYEGRLTLIGAERHLPYERPPLSKGYLAGNDARESFDVHDRDWYADNHVELLLGTAASAIDTAAHTVTLTDGRSIGYDKLLLATGSRPRMLHLAGSGASGVHTLRNVEDSELIGAAIKAGKSLAIIGGGWIGMEIAANARSAGCAVTVVETGELPLHAVLGPELARTFLDLHQQHGVEFKLNAQVTEITTKDAQATGLALEDGTRIEAELVIVGVGAAPNTEIATAAGLAADNGVLVDEALQSSDPDIVVAGDIANQQHPVLGRRIRVEHWANALNQPTAAAATMLGTPTPYTELPYFYSDQYDLGMEYVGYAPPGSYARVVTRGDVAGREFVAFWLDGDDKVLAGMNVNVWDVIDDIKALILASKPVDEKRLTDGEVALADVLTD